MKQKFFTFTLVLLLSCFMATGVWAAKKIDLVSANSAGYIQKMNSQSDHGHAKMGTIFGLITGEKFTKVRETKDFNGVSHTRYVQTFKGIPIWGLETVVSRDHTDEVLRIDGSIVLDVPKDVLNIPSALNPENALTLMQKEHKKKNTNAAWNFTNEKYGTYIYVSKKNRAELCYVVSFFADNEKGEPSRPIFFIDVKSGKVIDTYDMLAYGLGTGPGGNLKVGLYEYGTDYPGFCITEYGYNCVMICPDVQTVDGEHSEDIGSTYYYTPCYRNTHEAINGAYCPLNDAQYFGQVVCDMYMNWYGVPVLPFKLLLRCHYKTDYENAFWNGSFASFGDGHDNFYPLVALDIVAHEASHGFTEHNSDLIYLGQSGGINESYSDMAGEAAKYYMRGVNDFRVGYDIVKAPNEALRYMYDPPLDGLSIDHVSEYYDGLDVHLSSGIFNKAFYLIATSPGWTTRMAFDIFFKANMDYWVPNSSFQQGGEGAMAATLDYGYSCADVANAFAQVGITLSYPVVPVANFTGSPLSGPATLRVNFTDTSTNSPTSWSWSFGDGGTSTAQNPSHDYTAQGIYTVTLTATNAAGSDSETKTNYITVTPPQPPVANFQASPTSVVQGGFIAFTDLSSNEDSLSWTFEGGIPSTSTAQHPTVTYCGVGTFDVTLVATNAQGSDTETKVDYITITPANYCASQATSQNIEWISKVKVGYTLDNPSGPSPYSNFTALVANLPPAGKWVNYELVPGYPGSSYSGNWSIWIDFNKDTDFNDAGEQCVNINGTSTLTGSFRIPAGTSNSNTRMRVSMKYGGAPASCGTFSYGEVEDYAAYIGNQVSYCSSSGTYAIEEWIARVQIGTLSKSSGAMTYSDFTSSITNYTRGTLQNVTITPGYSEDAYYESFAVWIDYNKDGDFLDDGENVFSGYGNKAVSGSFTVPSSAATGFTRIRVAMKGGTAPTPCEVFLYGEVEDYAANIL